MKKLNAKKKPLKLSKQTVKNLKAKTAVRAGRQWTGICSEPTGGDAIC
jgi:hypothetical protein